MNNTLRNRVHNDNKATATTRTREKSVLRRPYLFHHPSLHQVLCIFFIPPFLLPNISKLSKTSIFNTHFLRSGHTQIQYCNILANIRSHPDDKVYNIGVTTGVYKRFKHF